VAAGYGEAMIWVLGGAVLVGIGIALAFDLWGFGGGLWRFWVTSYERWGLRPPANTRLVRTWFGALLIVVGAAWIYAGVA
jgi:hypothetical protein